MFHIDITIKIIVYHHIVVSKDRYYYNVIPVLEICPPHVNTTSIHNQTHGVLDLGPCTKYKICFHLAWRKKMEDNC